MKRAMFWLMAGVSLLGVGCVTLETTEERDQRLQQAASLTADVQALMEDRQRLVNMVQATDQQSQQFLVQLRQLGARVDLLEKQVSTTDVAYRQQLQHLQQLQRVIADESKARATAVDDLKKAASQELANMASHQQAQQKQLMKALEAAAASGGQGEYVVQKNDTLKMISKAAGVSLDNLRRANNLKSDALRVGQKLIIPRK